MQLWATGFNAWNQLDFCQNAEKISTDSTDIDKFTLVLEDDTIEILRAGVTSVLYETSSGISATGMPDELVAHCVEQQECSRDLAIAFNNKLVDCVDGTLVEYATVTDYKSGNGMSLRNFGRLQQLVAGTATFTALSTTGSVYTWGDARYQSCLARQPSDGCSASEPCLVEDLLDLPTGKIRKIASGGYHTAALTTSNDMYLWGGRPGHPKLVDDLENYPTPIDVDGMDWSDVAIGHDHIMALSTEGEVWMVGDGSNGQLGLGVVTDAVREWRKVSLNLGSAKVSSVHAGYKCSFLIVGNDL